MASTKWRNAPLGSNQRLVSSELRQSVSSEGFTKSRELLPFSDLLHDLPLDLQRAVRKAVFECRPAICPHHYTSDWEEELYHEAAVAAWQAFCAFDPERGSLYSWGLRIVRQQLKRFCDSVWRQARCECDWPCEEDSQEEVEFIDSEAQAAVEFQMILDQLLSYLGEKDSLVIKLYYLEGLTEREIAQLLNCSQKAVNKRVHRAIKRLREAFMEGV